MRRYEYRERYLTNEIDSMSPPPPPEEIKQVLDEYNEEYRKKHGGHGSAGVTAMVSPDGKILITTLYSKTDARGSKPEPRDSK